MAVTTNPRKTGIPAGATLLAQSAVAVSGAADTNENILAAIAIPGGAIGPNGSLRVKVYFSYSINANNKTLRVRLGGASGAAFLNLAQTNSGGISAVVTIQNRNDQASQFGDAIGINQLAVGFQQAATGSIDTSVDTTLVITGQKADGADAVTLDGYIVEVIYGG